MIKIKRKIQKFINNPNVPFLLLIGLLGILSPLSLFKDNLPLVGLDTWTPIDIVLRLKEWPYLWGHYSSMLGADFSGRIVFLPQMLSYYLLYVAGFSLVASQKIIFIQIFLTAGYSMYLLSMTLWKKRPMTAFISSLIFMFNPVMAGYWQQFLTDSLYSFVAFPLLLAIYIKGLESRNVLLYSALFSLLTLLFLPYNQPTYVMSIGILGSFFVFKLITGKNKIRMIKFSLLTLLFSLLINLWWIIPQFIWLPKFLTYFSLELKSAERLLSQGIRAALPNTIRLLGNSYWGYSLWGDKPSNYIGFLYENNPLLILLSFIYPFLSFCAILVSKRNKQVVFFTFMSLVFIFLAKGLQRPFGFVYELLFRKIPGFFIFRTPADKFWLAILIFYSLLIGFVLSTVYGRILNKKRWLSKAFFGVSVIVLLAIQWPFFTGDVIPNGRSAVPSVAFSLPSSYKDLSAWLKDQPDSFRILNLPGSNRPTRWLVYKWGFLGVYPLLSEIFNKPVVDKQPQEPSDFIRNAVYHQLGNSSDISTIINQKTANSQSAYKILGLMNIKYLLVNYDTDWQHMHYGSENPEEIDKLLQTQERIKPAINFGNLHLFELDKESIFPEIYSVPPGDESYYWGDKKQIANLFTFEDILPENMFYLNTLPETGRDSKLFIATDYQYFRSNYQKNYIGMPEFPYIRFLPNNPLYFYINWKDQKRISSAVTADEKIEVYLSQAKKRLAEIKLIIKDNESYSIKSLIEKYKESINNVVSVYEKEKSTDIYAYVLADSLISELNYQENFIRWAVEVLKIKGSQDWHEMDNLLFDPWYDVLNKYHEPWWYNPDSTEKGQVAYRFNVPQNDTYDIYINSGDLKSLNLSNSENSFLDFDLKNRNEFYKKVVWNTKNLLQNQWYPVSRTYLENGDYVLTHVNKNSVNLCQNCRWIISGKGKITENLDKNGKKVEKFEIPNREAVYIYTTLPVFDSTDNFRISFSYRNIKGRALKFLPIKSRIENFTNKDLLESIGQKFTSDEVRSAISANDGVNRHDYEPVAILNNRQTDLRKESEWQRFVADFNPGEGASVFGLMFTLAEGSYSDEVSNNEIKDFTIEKVFDNPIVLRSVSKNASKDERPKLAFQRINPTRYEIAVDTSNPFYLIFGQSFSPNWKLYLSENDKLDKEIVAKFQKFNVSELEPQNTFFKFSFLKEPEGERIADEKHFLANGYANGWLVEKTGEYRLTLEYWPQRPFYILILTTLALVTVYMIVVVYNLLKK